MSLVRQGGGVGSCGTLGSLGVVGRRCLGCAGSTLRVSGPFSFAAPSLSCSAPLTELQPQIHPGAGSYRRGVRPGCKGGYRAGSSFPGIFCDSQGHRRVAAGDRSLEPQRLGGCLPLPHGDYSHRSPVAQVGGLDGILDLQDAYLQVPVLPSSCRYLRFCVGDSVCQFRSLCFGLSTAPQAFTRVMAPVSSIMHCHGFRILRYLDDWLVLASTFQEIVRARDFLLWLCRQLGIHVNLPKSSLDPSQTRDYLGMTITFSPLRVFPTLKRIQKLSLLLHEFLSDRQHPVSVWRQLLGVMSSLSALVPGARLHMRSLQLRLNAAGPPQYPTRCRSEGA